MGTVQAKETTLEDEETFTLTIDENDEESFEETTELTEDGITENEGENTLVSDEVFEPVEDETIETEDSLIAEEEVLGIPTYQGKLDIESVGSSSYAILNGSGIADDGERTYMALSDGIYASAGNTSVIISNDKAENLNYGNGRLYYTVESDEGSIVKVIDLDNKTELYEILLSGCTVRHMYLINDSDLLFSAGGRIFILNPDSGNCEEYGNYEGVFSFIPTKNGILYATGSLFNYSIYAEDKFVSNASDYYTDDEYLCYSLNGEDFNVSLDKVFANATGDIGDYSETPYEVIDSETFTEELEDVVPTAEEENEETVCAKEIVNGSSSEKKTVKIAVDMFAAESDAMSNKVCNFTKEGNYYVPELSSIQKEIQDRAREVYGYTWTPLKEIKKWSESTKAYIPTIGEDGKPLIMHGAPYCQTNYGGVRVLYSMTMDEFMKETVKDDSKLYSTSSADWVVADTDDGLRYGPWYGFDCSMFASYCVGLEKSETTSKIASSVNFVKKGNQDSIDPAKLYEGIKVGDVLNKKGSHVIVITDIQYDIYGKIAQIETIEQTVPCTTRKTFKSVNDLFYNDYLKDEEFNVTYGDTLEKYYLYRSLRSDNNNVPLFSIEKPAETCYVTETYQLEGCGLPKATITWKSSDTTVATVDSSGKVTPKKAGKVTITATATIEAAGKVSAKIELNLKNPEITECTPTSQTIYTGDHFDISAKAMPEGGVFSYSSSDTSIVKVSSDGYVSGLKSGKASVTVKYTKNKKSGSKKVTVNVKKRSITLSETAKTMYYKQTLQLKATVKPNDAPVSWTSSNSKIVTVDSTGKVEIIKNTSTASDSPVKITAKLSTGEKEVCKITVKKPSVTLSKTSATLYSIGLTNLALTATTKPSESYVEWSSSNPSVASVDSSGNVTAKSKGTATIKAKMYVYDSNKSPIDCGISKSCKVTVNDPSISLSKTKITDLYVNKTKTLTATVKPSGTSVTWSSDDTSVVTVDSSGKLTGKSKGSAKIKATIFKGTAKEKSATCTVTVINPSLKLDKSKVTVYRGFTSTIKATPKPAATVTYSSSDTKIATVDSTGKIKGKKNGSVTITVSANGISKTCSVTVKDPALNVTKTSATVLIDETITLKKETKPSGAAVNWKSSDTSIATVDSEGKVTGKKAGTVTITATLENATDVKDTCIITVKPVIEVETTSVMIQKGSSKTIKVTCNSGNTLSYSISKSMPSSGVVTIKKTLTGVKITAKKTGTAVVTVKAGSKKEEITVNCYQ